MGIIIDSFAGGGGASCGIEAALGRHVDIAINHSPEAVTMHEANHPYTEHHCQNIWAINPNDLVPRGPVDLLWASPDCTHHSKAKGGKPIRDDQRQSRDLAWVILSFAKTLRPNIIMLENVEEFADWGPLLDTGRPCPDRKGFTFRRWVKEHKRLGYAVEWKELRGCDFGAPTIRKRLFVIMRRDGKPIAWPIPTHGPGTGQPYRTAAEIIDWTLPVYSIFMDAEDAREYGVKRPLAEATMERIAKGVMRYVVNNPQPFIVTANHGGAGFRGQSLDEPFKTVTAARDAHGLIVPHITKFRQGSSGAPIDGPMPTITANSYIKRPGGAPPLGVVTAFLAQHNTGMVGHDAREPVSTIVGKGSTQGLVAAHLTHLYGSDQGGAGDPRAPMKTVTAGGFKHGVVSAFLTKYYGQGGQLAGADEPMHTIPTKDRMGLVVVEGQTYQIEDIGMRMLTPRELFRAQGFPDSYIIDPPYNGKPMTKSAQVRACGNSVCPQIATALVRANMAEARKAVA